jgi:hypothetical protein
MQSGFLIFIINARESKIDFQAPSTACRHSKGVGLAIDDRKAAHLGVFAAVAACLQNRFGFEAS